MKPNQIALIVIGNGRRDYLVEAMGSLKYLWGRDITHRILVDDTGDADYHRYLHDTYPHFTLVAHPTAQGMAAAVATAHNEFLRTGASRMLAWEEDMVLNGPVDVPAWDALLSSQPHLAQLVLKRNVYTEPGVDDFMDLNPEQWVEHEVAEGWYVETSSGFSFNPALVPRRVIQCVRENPGDGLERGVTDALLAEGYRFGWWGRRHDKPLVTHIGERRAPTYRL